jgi:hypothetical protein
VMLPEDFQNNRNVINYARESRDYRTGKSSGCKGNDPLR